MTSAKLMVLPRRTGERVEGEQVRTGQAAGVVRTALPVRAPMVELRGRVNRRRSWVNARVRVG
jgi:hypothetical protein